MRVVKQRRHAAFRVLIAIIVPLYAFIHSPLLKPYITTAAICAVIYLTYGVLAYIQSRQSLFSPIRILFEPMLDIGFASIFIFLDGGTLSPLFLLYFVYILTSGVRFGTMMLLYAQSLAILGLITISQLLLLQLDIALDSTLLLIQTIALLVFPYYLFTTWKPVEQRAASSHDQGLGWIEQSSIPTFTFHLDPSNMPRILYANPASTSIYRDSLAQIRGNQVDIFSILEDGEVIVDACKTVLQASRADETTATFYIRGRNTHGDQLRLMGIANPVNDQEKTTGICQLIDLTSVTAMSRSIARAAQKSAVQSALSKAIHSFRNTLFSVSGHAEIAQFSKKKEDIAEQIELILQATETSTKVLEELEASQIDPPQETILEYPDDIGLNILSLHRIQLPSNIQLHTDIDNNLPAINVSVSDFSFLLTQLVDQAALAITDTGDISVEFFTEFRHASATEQNSSLCIRVRDNGPGFTEENMNEVIRLARNPDNKAHIALANAYRICNRLGGGLEFVATPGDGSCITVHLPAYAPNRNPAEMALKAPSQKNRNRQDGTQKAQVSWNILLVDDNPDALKIHHAFLDRLSHTVLTAESGKDALDAFQKQQQKIDLLITDFRMPNMDGLELCEAIRKHSPNLPILIITAFGDEDRLRNAKLTNFMLLNKPITLRQLERAIIRFQKMAQAFKDLA